MWSVARLHARRHTGDDSKGSLTGQVVYHPVTGTQAIGVHDKNNNNGQRRRLQTKSEPTGPPWSSQALWTARLTSQDPRRLTVRRALSPGLPRHRPRSAQLGLGRASHMPCLVSFGSASGAFVLFLLA